jgi:hypothetical protein
MNEAEEADELNQMMVEMRDLEIVKDLLDAVINLKEYTSRLNDGQGNEFQEHVDAVAAYSKEGNQSHIKYHLTCAKRILESARDWES